jgi:hypothetical protein
MHRDTGQTRGAQSEERPSQESAAQESLMTPARRAALEALEREFRDLLTAAAQL